MMVVLLIFAIMLAGTMLAESDDPRMGDEDKPEKKGDTK